MRELLEGREARLHEAVAGFEMCVAQMLLLGALSGLRTAVYETSRA